MIEILLFSWLPTICDPFAAPKANERTNERKESFLTGGWQKASRAFVAHPGDCAFAIAIVVARGIAIHC
jgi:hypothetical protein